MTVIMWRSDTRWGHVRGQPLRFVKGHNHRLPPGVPRADSLPGYDAVHKWANRHRPRTGTCEHCHRNVGTRNGSGTQLANKSREYRYDVSDYMELCRSCHRRYDLGLLILSEFLSTLPA